MNQHIPAIDRGVVLDVIKCSLCSKRSKQSQCNLYTKHYKASKDYTAIPPMRAGVLNFARSVTGAPDSIGSACLPACLPARAALVLAARLALADFFELCALVRLHWLHF